MRSSLLAVALALVAVSHGSAQVGSVVRSQRVNALFGGLVGPLHEGDEFGYALAALGDLNGDGVTDLAVGAPFDGDGGPRRGAIWILLLKPDGSVLAEQKISQTQGGFGGSLLDESNLGLSLAAVGDLDGDGLSELAAFSRLPNRLWVLFLDAGGAVRSVQENLFTDPVFGPGADATTFYYSQLVALGDLDGDGLGDLAISAPKDSDGLPEAGAVWITRLRADGGFKAAHKISQTQGGFGGTLYEDGYFGLGMSLMGDLDGDGNRELGVSSPYGPPFGGTFWVLYLDANEQVVQEIPFEQRLDYGLVWPGSSDYVTRYHHWLGDLDGDGDGEIALGFPYENFPGGSVSEGGIAIGSVRPDGTVPWKLRISDHRGGLGDLPRRSSFGAALAPLGDLDGDGLPELAVGAPGDPAGPLGRTGGLWVLSLATSAVRNGSGQNPLTLTQAADPAFASTWSLTLDASGHAPGPAILVGYSQPLAGQATPWGERLVGGTALFQLRALHAGGPTPFQLGLPPLDLSLIDLPVHVQGLVLGAPGAQLSNALDVVVGR